MVNEFKVYINYAYPVGYDVVIKSDVWLKTRFSTWTRRGARREARKWCRRRDASASITFF